MKNKPKDRHLDVPSEANMDKHINFTALKNEDIDPAGSPSTGVLADKDNKEKTFNLVIDGVPYTIKAAPFSFNDETRFYVSVNNGPEHVFVRDTRWSN